MLQVIEKEDLMSPRLGEPVFQERFPVLSERVHLPGLPESLHSNLKQPGRVEVCISPHPTFFRRRSYEVHHCIRPCFGDP